MAAHRTGPGHRVVALTATLAAAGMSAACAGGPPGGGGTGASTEPPGDLVATGDYERSVYAFAIEDSAGVAYDHPLLGGFDVPRPQFVDIDADGDLDLFVQERSNELMFFENLGTASDPEYRWRTDRFHDLEIGEWNRFVDLDEDGDFDLLAELPFSYVRYYRNQGTPSEPRFSASADSVRDASGTALFADRQNLPSLVDIDCDGRLDLFIGRVEGTVTRYELVADWAPAEPRFEFVTERWEGIEIIGQIGSRHGANAMAFADVDGDGDHDLYWGDFFEPGVLRIDNVGSCEQPSLRSTPVALSAENDPMSTSGYNVPVFADVDGDRDLDVFLGVLGGAFNPNRSASDNFHFYERVESGRLSLRSRRYLRGFDVGSQSVPTLLDMDADGDLDLLVTAKLDPTGLDHSRVLVFENQGGRGEPRFRHVETLSPFEGYNLTPAAGDLDGDGDLDLLVGRWNRGKVALLRNDGSAERPRWALADSALVTLSRGSYSAPALGDLDGDGDLDLMIGEGSGTLNYYRNDGDRSAPSFTLVSDEYLDVDAGQRSFPVLVDLDGDGDLDLLVGSEVGRVDLYRNLGTVREARFQPEPSFALPLPGMSTPTFADLDGDGDLDVLSGSASGGLTYLVRR